MKVKNEINGTDENGTTSKRIGGICNIESGKINYFLQEQQLEVN